MKNEIQDMEYKVRIFMASYRQYVPDKSQPSNKLRASLIKEEYLEFAARTQPDELALDGICDLLYVLLGTRVHFAHESYKGVIDSSCEPLNVTIHKVYQAVDESGTLWVGKFLDVAIAQVYSIGTEFADVAGAFAEVHRTNMQKFWTAAEIRELGEKDWTVSPHLSDEGLFIVQDSQGKVRKPPSWKGPELTRFLKK